MTEESDVAAPRGTPRRRTPGSSGLPAGDAVVLHRGDDGYDDLRRGLNRAVDSHPDAVVEARHVDDVRAAVRLARSEDRPVGVLSTGHGPSVPYDAAVLVNTRRLDAVAVDPDARTARIEAGARWRDVLAATTPHGLAPLNGSSPHVGVMGYTLGGGAGLLGRRYGFAADHVRSIEIVTADGGTRTASVDVEPDLFWALRGAGANFGVATAIEIDLFPVEELYGGELAFPARSTADVITAYVEWTGSVPEQMASSVLLIRYPDLPEMPETLRGQFVTHVRIAWSGPTSDGPDLVRPLRGVGDPLLDTVGAMPYRDVGTIHHEPVDAPVVAFEGNILLGAMDGAAVDTLLAHAGPDSGAPFIAELRHFGGAYARPAAVPNAVGGRDATFSLYSGTDADAAHRRQRYAFERAMAPWSTGQTLLNFMGAVDADSPTSAQVHAPADLARLQELKRRWDPSNTFRINHNIEPA